MKELMKDILSRLGTTAETEPFEVYYDMLRRKNEVMNLTAITEPDEVAIRHFADSLALLSMYDFKNKKVIDVGCGAGFPGIPLKLGESTITLTLLDSLNKRISFLEDVCERLGLENVECIHARAEELAQKEGYRESFDIAVSRAVAELPLLCEITLPYVSVGGVFIAMKSTHIDDELESAQKAISVLGGRLEDRIDYPLHDTGITHTALIIRKERETPKKYPRRFAKIKSSPIK